MFEAKVIAEYFLAKDPHKVLFTDNIIVNGKRKFYEGNVRLNKYLFLSQVVYLAKYGKSLISDNFVVYENGPVVENVMSNYQTIYANVKNANIDSETKMFLDKIYFALENASYDELIEITHEDPEWIRLSDKTYNAPTMNLEKNIEEYKHRYKGLIEALDL